MIDLYILLVLLPPPLVWHPFPPVWDPPPPVWDPDPLLVAIVGEGTLTSSIFFVTTIARATANAIIANRQTNNEHKTARVPLFPFFPLDVTLELKNNNNTISRSEVFFLIFYFPFYYVITHLYFFWELLCRSFFVHWSFFLWPSYCLSFFNLRPLITPYIVSSKLFLGPYCTVPQDIWGIQHQQSRTVLVSVIHLSVHSLWSML